MHVRTYSRFSFSFSSVFFSICHQHSLMCVMVLYLGQGHTVLSTIGWTKQSTPCLCEAVRAAPWWCAIYLPCHPIEFLPLSFAVCVYCYCVFLSALCSLRSFSCALFSSQRIPYSPIHLKQHRMLSNKRQTGLCPSAFLHRMVLQKLQCFFQLVGTSLKNNISTGALMSVSIHQLNIFLFILELTFSNLYILERFVK